MFGGSISWVPWCGSPCRTAAAWGVSSQGTLPASMRCPRSTSLIGRSKETAQKEVSWCVDVFSSSIGLQLCVVCLLSKKPGSERDLWWFMPNSWLSGSPRSAKVKFTQYLDTLSASAKAEVCQVLRSDPAQMNAKDRGYSNKNWKMNPVWGHWIGKTTNFAIFLFFGNTWWFPY